MGKAVLKGREGGCGIVQDWQGGKCGLEEEEEEGIRNTKAGCGGGLAEGVAREASPAGSVAAGQSC